MSSLELYIELYVIVKTLLVLYTKHGYISGREYSVPAYVTIPLTCPKGWIFLSVYVDNLTAVGVKGT